ncbi:MAG: ATP-binding protein [Bacteroidota bacterium]
MERFKKNTLNNVYYRSRNLMMVMYLILVTVMTVLSANKLAVFVFATSIPFLFILSEVVYKLQELNPYYISIPLCLVLNTFYELNATTNEPFWLYFIVIIYHTILFIDKKHYTLFFVFLSIVLVFTLEYYIGSPGGVIASRFAATVIFSITTYIGFGYLLDTQTEVFTALQNKDEAEKMLKAYAKDLEKKNSELDQFAYVVSHDLKAPLRGINNLSIWIEEDMGVAMNEDAHNNFVLLRSRVTRMENLINGILAYSRAGRTQDENVYFSTYDLIHDICATLNSDTKITIIQPLPFLKTAKVQMEQVFSNLVSNAIKYNQNPHPEIIITSIETDTECTFCVADNGPGIDSAYHQKIFVIFQTLQSRDTLENTGVGLAIVKKIVEERGGQIWVESKVGHGAKFYFTWPK